MTYELDRIPNPMGQSLLVSGGVKLECKRLGSVKCEQNAGLHFMSLRDYAFCISATPRKMFFFFKKKSQYKFLVYCKITFTRVCPSYT